MLMKDLRAKKIDELNDLIIDLKAQLFTFHFKNATSQNDQTHKIGLIKKDIARVFTAITEKERTLIKSKTSTTKVQPKKILKSKKILKVTKKPTSTNNVESKKVPNTKPATKIAKKGDR